MAKEIDYQKRNKIYKLANLIGIIEHLENMRVELSKQGKEMLKKEISISGNYEASIIAKILERYDEFNDKIQSSIDYSEIVDAMMETYYEKFSEEEIDKLIVILSSDIGIKWIKTNRDMTPKLAEISAKWNQQTYTKSAEIMQKFMEDEGLFGENSEDWNGGI
jgi:hypothetical protein